MSNKHLRVPLSVLAVLAIGAPAFGCMFNEPNADTIIETARARQTDLMNSSNAILAAAEAESRDLTDAERTQINGLTAEFDQLEADIQIRERVAAQNALLTTPRNRQTEADPIDPVEPEANGTRQNNAVVPRAPTPRVPAAAATGRGTGGFRFLGEFANAVRLASVRGGDLDARLRNALTTYGNEGTGADGGFAVPTDYRTDLLTRMFDESDLLSLTDRLQSSSNTITLPKDETTPWQTTGGIQAYWTAEAGTKTQSKPALGEVTVKLHTLAALIPMTDELLEDAPAMGSYLNRKAPERMRFKVSDAIVRGSGVGQPLGFLNSPALVSVAIESGPQTTDTIVAANIAKMFARMPASSLATAVWLIHPDAMPQLHLMTLGQVPIYQPPGGFSQSPFGTLLGRPVIPHQVAETVGDLGDIMFVDLKQYLSVTKAGSGRDANGIKQDVSIHLYFDQDSTAFRFTMRVGGLPWWGSTIAQRDGTSVQSPYVVLATR